MAKALLKNVVGRQEEKTRERFAKRQAKIIPIAPAQRRRDTQLQIEKAKAKAHRAKGSTHSKRHTEETHMPAYNCAGYIQRFLEPKELAERVDLTVLALKKYKNKFDAIAFSGMSGALIAPPVALKMGKSLIMVRKPEHSTHSSYEVEGDYAAKRYIIVDDFRSSGATEDRIYRAIKRDIPNAEYMGFMGANGLRDWSAEDTLLREKRSDIW